MRYIRTKETDYGSIIDTEKYKEATGEECYIPPEEIVKESDFLGELCDMFVFRAGEYIIIDKDNDEFFRKNWKCYDTIYGAIWTDKGLISVAKMNKKGELELL